VRISAICPIKRKDLGPTAFRCKVSLSPGHYLAMKACLHNHKIGGTRADKDLESVHLMPRYILLSSLHHHCRCSVHFISRGGCSQCPLSFFNFEKFTKNFMKGQKNMKTNWVRCHFHFSLCGYLLDKKFQ